MAIMYPGSIDLAKLSLAERNLYMLFRDRLDDSYLVFYNISSSSHSKRKRHGGEVDFVIVHPDKGVLVLEVKGGQIIYDPQTKYWTRLSRTGVVLHIKSPIEQIRSNRFILLDSLKEFFQEHNMENGSSPLSGEKVMRA